MSNGIISSRSTCQKHVLSTGARDSFNVRRAVEITRISFHL